MHAYLYRSQSGLPPLNKLTDLEREELIEPIGPTGLVRQKLDELFPGLRWEQIAGTWSGAHSTCRTPYIDILLSDDAPGVCKFIVLNKADASIVQRVMESFHLNYACWPESGKLIVV